ncbi:MULTISPECIES: alpha/beta fold hydrolase [Agrobacterium]|uniref:alpha/beta fold hydrolase n=1 Tax=Agrobacterium tumefaciens TaxID=358 RepID=UPI00129A3D0B|nr:alpha/beta hydrolase [Agrobacterium tumefaciens]MRH97050.1 alpha/beta fold hydrolase [Agrobacterium tumefaciens]NSY61722.1 alpha/beta hydrolase [Agrobacterium tumefaciens]WCK22196.1 alpha/beta hydrolase [Agrobacterium tumefaciens]
MSNFSKVAVCLVAALLSSVAVTAPALADARNIVLVHGALVDGSGWRGVYDILTRDGYNVSIVQQPLTSLDQDIAATMRVVDQQDGDVVLVGHSYGGTIITAAGDDPKVKALVYVAALQPEKGESTAQLLQSMPSPTKDIKPSKDGFLLIDRSKFAADFGADLPKDQAEFMARSQMPVAVVATDTPVAAAAWHEKPSYAIVAKDDMTINPDLERWMYKRAGSTVTEVEGSHAIYISQAAAVAKVIEEAAKAAK